MYFMFLLIKSNFLFIINNILIQKFFFSVKKINNLNFSFKKIKKKIRKN